MTWRATDPLGNESAKIKWEIVPFTRGRGIDIGCGPKKLYPHWIGVDSFKDAELFGVQYSSDIIRADAEDLSIFATRSMDFVFSSHTLEHIKPDRVADTLKEWWRLIKEGGYLTLYLPDEDEYPKMGEPEANPDHQWNVNKDAVIEYMRGIKGWDLIDYQKRNGGKEYSLYFVFKKVGQGQHFSYQKKSERPAKTAGVVRYGAFGDLLQASTVFAGLKKQGYHVTLFCSPPGHEVVQFDPNIDEFYYQDKDQVPNLSLIEFWDYHKPRFDKWVNLCESVEGTFLSLPGRAVHAWPAAARHRVMDVNYVEMQHMLAGVPHEPRIMFYPTAEEREWARKERKKMGAKVLVWALAGSAVHKTWPGLDQVVASIMLHYPEWDVVLMGGERCKILEQGWGEEKRVHKRSGEWSIRQSMTFLELADCVVGPETGIMNAASGLDIPKVVFLSHSSDENLTRDWANTIALTSRGTKCHGRGNDEAPACHMMHYNWQFCTQALTPDGEKSGVAQCQWDIPVEQAWHAIEHAMRYEREKVA